MKRKVKYQDREVEGTEVSFSVIQQDWCEYALNDGTTLRMQTVVTSIVRVDGEYVANGDPLYVAQSQHIATVSNVPEHLRKK